MTADNRPGMSGCCNVTEEYEKGVAKPDHREETPVVIHSTPLIATLRVASGKYYPLGADKEGNIMLVSSDRYKT